MTTMTRRTALIGGTSALAGTMFLAGNITAHQEATPPDDSATVDTMTTPRIVTAAQNALTIVETDRATVTPASDGDLIDALLQRGGDLIAEATVASEPRRQAIAAVTLLAAAQVLMAAPASDSLPSQAGVTSQILVASSQALTRFIDVEPPIATDLSDWPTDLYARAYASFEAGRFGSAARQAQAAALVAAGGRILATGDTDLADLTSESEDEDDPGWRRFFRHRRGDRHLALAAPVVRLLRPIAIADVPAPNQE